MRRVCTEHNVAPVHCVLQDGVFRVEANLRVPLTDAEYDRLLRVFQSRTTRYGTFAPLETLVQVPRELGSVEMLYVQLQLVNVEAVRVRSLRDQPILAEAVADVPDEPNSARPRAQRSRSAIRYTPNPPLPESPWTTPEHDALVREVLGRNLREREREQVLTSWVGDEAEVRVADTPASRGTSVYARGADTRTQRGRGEKKKGARKSQPAEPVFPGKPGRRKLVFDD